MKRSIYILLPTVSAVGPINVVFDICAELFSDFAITVLVLGETAMRSRRDDFERIGINVIRVNIFDIFKILSSAKVGDIFHSHGLRPDLLAFFLSIYYKNKINFFSTVHSKLVDDYCMSYGKLKGIPAAMLHAEVLKIIPGVISVSDVVGQYLASQGVGNRRIFNGIDVNRFSRASDFFFRKKIGILEGEKLVVSVGSLSYLKNQQLIIRALASSGRKDIKIYFLGGDSLKGELFKLASQLNLLDQVFFTGMIPNVEEYLGVADYVISASQTEGLPCAVLEAISAGCVAILSNIKAHLELTLNPEMDRLISFFKLNDVRSLELTFLSIPGCELSNPHYRDAAFREFRAIYSRERMGAEYRRTYGDLSW